MLPADEGLVPLPADAGRGTVPAPPQAPPPPPLPLLPVVNPPCLLPHVLLLTGGDDAEAPVPQAPVLVGGDLPADPQLTLPLYVGQIYEVNTQDGIVQGGNPENGQGVSFWLVLCQVDCTK